MKLESANAKMTARVGHALAKEIVSMKSPRAVLVALSGELGAGKTTFARGFMKGLSVRAKTQSPTFVLMKKFAIPKKEKSQFQTLFHIDAYRIRHSRELLQLGFGDILADRRNIVLLEWPEKVRSLLPKRYIRVSFRHTKTDHERMLTIQEIK